MSSGDSSRLDFLLGGNSTYSYNQDFQIGIPNQIIVAESALFNFSRFDDLTKINNISISIDSLRTHGTWIIPHFVIPASAVIRVFVPEDFLRFENREAVTYFSDLSTSLSMICSRSLTPRMFEFAFLGTDWTHKWRSLFKFNLTSDSCISFQITEPLYETIYCLEGENGTCHFPSE
jgi:hypothetical protein